MTTKTIKEIRMNLKLSQQKFADKFGIPVGTLQHWEQGVSKPPAYVVNCISRIVYLESVSAEDEVL